MMRNNRVFAVALGGILTALSTVLMLFGSIIPFATFVVPCIAAVSVLYFHVEHGIGLSALSYLGTSILSALLAPDKELAMVFILVTGPYPAVKLLCEKLRPALVRLAAKTLFFNAAIWLMYSVVTRIFVMDSVRRELEELAGGWTIVLLALANVTFWLYDILLTRLINWYRHQAGTGRFSRMSQPR